MRTKRKVKGRKEEMQRERKKRNGKEGRKGVGEETGKEKAEK